jgi:hypothetical protein
VILKAWGFRRAALKRQKVNNFAHPLPCDKFSAFST